jgi:peptide/nickel transport system permease protein
VGGDPNRQELLESYAEPGARGHVLGTDPLGRDLLAWSAAGVRTALVVAVGTVGLSAALGTAIGAIAGYCGGRVDALLMRFADLQLAVPPLLLFIAASARFEAGTVSLILLLTLVSWVPYARVVRTTALATRERSYVAAARLAGAPLRRMLVLHVVPPALTSVLVLSSLQAGYVFLWESSLSFVGLGLQPPDASLGYMVAQGKDELVQAWWISTLPGLVIVLLVLSFNLIGDGLRDVFDTDRREDDAA